MVPDQSERCRFVYPLGRAGRFGMTPGQARTYAAIVAYADRHHGAVPSMRALAALIRCGGLRTAHERIQALVERGWLIARPSGKRSRYELTEPVMRFLKAPGHD